MAAKEAEKAAKAAEREQKKAEKLAAKEAEKAAKAAERKAKKAEKKETKKTTKVMAPALKIPQEEFDAIDQLEMEKEEAYEKNYQDAVDRYQQSKYKEIDEEKDGEPVSISLPASPVPETGDDDATEEAEAVKFTHEGKTYLKTSDNLVYNEDALESDQAEPIGEWNPVTKTIEDIDLQTDDEEDDSDDEDDE